MSQLQKAARQWAIDHIGLSFEMGGRIWTLAVAGGFTVVVEEQGGEERRRIEATEAMGAFMAEFGGAQ